MGHDLVIRGGRVVDGTGAPAATADVAIDDGRVTAVGRVTEPGQRHQQAQLAHRAEREQLLEIVLSKRSQTTDQHGCQAEAHGQRAPHADLGERRAEP